MAYDAYIRRAEENGQPIFNDFCLTDEEKDAAFAKGIAKESLETLKRTLSPLQFSGQYMNDPLDDDLVEFKREWFLCFDRSPELFKTLASVPAILSVDPAFGLKQTNDFSGIVVSKTTPDGLIYILEAKQIKVNPNDLVTEIFRYVDIYQPSKALIETVSAQVMLTSLLREKMRELNKYFTVEEVQPNTRETKAMRIRGLIPYYANGRVLHARGLNDLEQQLLEFPRGIHDDIIDSLAYHQAYWGRGIKTPPRQVEKPYTLNWWKKQPTAGQKRSQTINALFGDLLNGRSTGI